jgi:hypothetical protein
MSPSYPPRLASALMRWMGPRDEALVGDLFEAYRSGRSDWWYWRQVLASIVIGNVTVIRAHKVLALRAIVLGWGVWVLYANYLSGSVFTAARTALNFTEVLFVTGLLDWFYVHNIDLPVAVLVAGPTILTAWIGMFASGWLVGYFHRSHGASLVLAYLASLPVPTVGTVLWRVVVLGVYPGPELPAFAAFMLVAICLPALAGGLWAVGPRERFGLAAHE